MKPKYSAGRPFFPTILTLAGLALAASSASAAILYWDNNSTTAGFSSAAGTWSSAGTNLWNQDVLGGSASGGFLTSYQTTTSDTLNFGTTASALGFGTITVSGTVNAGNLNFETSGSGPNDFILNGGTINLAATSTIFNGGNINTIDSALSGATNLTITGGGTLKFSGGTAGFGAGGTATVAGTTNVQFTSGGANGLGGSTGFTINLGNATTGGTLSVANSSVNNANKITVMDGTGTRTLTAGGTIAATYTGVITANQNLTVTFASSASGGFLTVNGAFNTIASTKTVTFNSSGTVNNLTDSALWSGLGAISYIGDDASSTAIIGAKTYAGGATIGNFSSTGAAIVGTSSAGAPNAPTSGSFGTGTLTLANGAKLRATTSGDITVHNPVTFTGNVTFVDGGAIDKSLILTGDAALGAVTRTLTVATGTTVAGKVVDFQGIISSTGAFGITKAGTGTLKLSGTNTYTGDTTITGGTLALSGAGSIASSPLIKINSTTTLDVTGLTAPTFTIGSSQTVGGNGTILATGKTVAANGTLSPGNSPGTLTQDGGTLQLGVGGDLNWQVFDASGVAGTGYDTVSLTNGATLDLSLLSAVNQYNINLWSLSGVGPDVNGNATSFVSTQSYTWTLFSTASDLTAQFDPAYFAIFDGANNGTTGFSNSLGGGVFSVGLGDSNTDIVLNFTAIPEPRAALLGAIGLLALLRRRR